MSHPHLPEGRPPGPQSIRRARSVAVLKGIGGAMGGGCLGLLYVPILLLAVGDLVYVATRPGEVMPAGWAILAVLFMLAVGLPLLAWRIVRGRRAAEAGFRVELPRTEAARGEEVEARVVVESGDPRPLEVGLVCTVWYDEWIRHHSTDGTSNVARGTSAAAAHEEWQQLRAVPGSQALHFRLPREAPFSHEGECLSFSWRVAARERLGGRRDPSADAPLWVLP